MRTGTFPIVTLSKQLGVYSFLEKPENESEWSQNAL